MNVMRPKLLIVCIGVILGAVGFGLVSCQRKPTWPASVQKVPDESKPLTPDESLKTVVMPPGYHLELVASEPMVQDPVAIEFGPDGRLWVIEMPGFMPENAEQDSREPMGRIVTLEDTNDDGKMDKRTVFLDGLVLPRAVKVLDKGVLVGEPPNLWLARDTDGDGKADAKDLLHDQYGRREANPEHNANSLLWGMDNVLHTSEHNFSYRFKNGKFEAMPTLLRGQWGMTMDDAGRIYRNWNEQPLFVDVVPSSYFTRNPNIVRTRGAYEELIARKDTATWPIRPTRGVNRGYRDGVLRPDGTITTYQSAATPLIYRGDRLPKELQGNAFVTDCTGQLVHRLVINDDGSGRLSARDAYPQGEFIASTDEWFRPVNLANGPDGTFYVVDMYRGVVQDGQYQTDYLRDYIKQHKLQAPVGMGRIYRVVHDSTKRESKPNLQKEASTKLVELISHPSGWRRDWAQQLLVERGDKSIVDALKNQAQQAVDFRTKLHALWTLDGLEALDVPIVTSALNDNAPEVRAAALRLSERWLTDAKHAIVPEILKHKDETNYIVLRQLAATLGTLPPTEKMTYLGDLLEKWGADPVLVDVIVSGLAGQEGAVLAKLIKGKYLQDAEEMLTAAISKSRNPAEVEKLLLLAASAENRSSHTASLLRGIDYGLSPLRGGGGRPLTLGSGGGATPALPVAAGSGRAAPIPPLAFGREPAALKTLLADGNPEIVSLAKKIAGRVTWPGKPDAAPEVPKLSAEEEKHFAAGQQLYTSICAGCHQADGLGKEKIAPALVQSQFVTGSAAVMARIILAGKEGTVGLMPPQGQALSDEQIAAVMTYVRREWGHTASAVAPAEVKEVRGMTASRKTPWADAELTRLLNAGPGGAPAARPAQ